MSVYVDDAMIPYRGMRMSHLIADSHDELIAMVDAIGVNRRWIQRAGTAREHFDISASKRELAIRHGAKAVSSRELGEMYVARTRTERMADEAPVAGEERR